MSETRTPDVELSDDLLKRAASESELEAADLARIAAEVLKSTPSPALVLQTPSGRIVAASHAASKLLDPGGGTVVGRLLEEYTTDSPVGGTDMVAGGRLNGFETIRTLQRHDGPDVPVRLWVRNFDHQPASRLVLVVLVTDRPRPHAELNASDLDPPAVVGTANASLIIERISADAESLFALPVNVLLGQSLLSLVAEGDVPSALSGLGEATAGRHGVSLYLDVRTADAPKATAATRCEVLLLPLLPSPSCAFVFLPAPAGVAKNHVSGDLSAMLLRLTRGAAVAQFAGRGLSGLSERDVPGLRRLTTRELEIVLRLLDGDRVPAIAAELFLSQSTVRNHLGSVFTKLGVSSQQELLRLFRKAASTSPST
jgi:DNA-binding CsgD family transcriptional regulator